MSTTPTHPGTNTDPMTKASDMAHQAADRAAEMGREAVDRLDANRESVAHGIHQTAEAIRSKAPAPVADKARVAADAMQRAADYIRSRDVRRMGSDLTSTVRENPGPSLIAAVAVGFLLGVVLRRD